MKEIKEIICDIKDELGSAGDYAYEAIKHKEQYPGLAKLYHRIAEEKLDRVDDLHREIVSMIDKKRQSGAEVPASMAAIWDFEHGLMIDEAAEIRHKLDMYNA